MRDDTNRIVCVLRLRKGQQRTMNLLFRDTASKLDHENPYSRSSAPQPCDRKDDPVEDIYVKNHCPVHSTSVPTPGSSEYGKTVDVRRFYGAVPPPPPPPPPVPSYQSTRAEYCSTVAYQQRSRACADDAGPPCVKPSGEKSSHAPPFEGNSLQGQGQRGRLEAYSKGGSQISSDEVSKEDDASLRDRGLDCRVLESRGLEGRVAEDEGGLDVQGSEPARHHPDLVANGHPGAD